MNFHVRNLSKILVAAAATFLCVVNFAVAQGFDELRGSDGSIRPVYQGVYSVYSRLSDADKKRIRKQTEKDFTGDNALNPLPRILTEAEMNLLRTGVQQRIQALKRFLEDHYAGGRRYIRDGIIPAPVIDAILARHPAPAEGVAVDPSNLAWIHGPDIFRLSDGSFTVVEDNIGYLGGIGDLILARESLLKRIPQYAPFLESSPAPERFYKNLLDRYKERAKGGPVVLLQYVRNNVVDNEDLRVRKIYEDAGIDVVMINDSKRDDARLRKRLSIRKNGVYLERFDDRGKTLSAIRAGFIAANIDIESFTAVPGLKKAIQTGLVASNYSPGVSFMEDKEFHVYVGKLIRYYLKEEPLLTEVQTRSFAKLDSSGKLVLDQESFAAVFLRLDAFVIKGVTGLGGEQVWIGPKMRDLEAIESLKRKILKNPDGYIAQDFSPLSQLDGQIVDLRLITDVGPGRDDVLCAPVPWGRSVSMKGDGKVNISASGSETAVFVLPEPGRCDSELRR